MCCGKTTSEILLSFLVRLKNRPDKISHRKWVMIFCWGKRGVYNHSPRMNASSVWKKWQVVCFNQSVCCVEFDDLDFNIISKSKEALAVIRARRDISPFCNCKPLSRMTLCELRMFAGNKQKSNFMYPPSLNSQRIFWAKWQNISISLKNKNDFIQITTFKARS